MRDYLVVYQQSPDGWIVATVPELPGAVTQGRTMAEARENIRDAIELILDHCRETAKGSDATWELVAVG